MEALALTSSLAVFYMEARQRCAMFRSCMLRRVSISLSSLPSNWSSISSMFSEADAGANGVRRRPESGGLGIQIRARGTYPHRPERPSSPASPPPPSPPPCSSTLLRSRPLTTWCRRPAESSRPRTTPRPARSPPSPRRSPSGPSPAPSPSSRLTRRRPLIRQIGHQRLHLPPHLLPVPRPCCACVL